MSTMVADLDKAPRLSISIVILILSSDVFTICQLNQFNTNSEAAMLSRKETNAFAIHLALFHPDDQGDITNFNIQVKGLFQKPLTRQKTEAIRIQSSTAKHRINSKAEHRQPAMLRVTMTRENDDQQLPRQAGQRRRGD